MLLAQGTKAHAWRMAVVTCTRWGRAGLGFLCTQDRPDHLMGPQAPSSQTRGTHSADACLVLWGVKPLPLQTPLPDFFIL